MMKKSICLLWIAVILAILLGSIGLIAGLGLQKTAPQIGRIAPDFSLKGIKGDTLNLKSIVSNNKLTIVNFWATWCPPCNAEIPEFIEFAKKYKTEKVALVAVNLQEDSKQVKEFAKNAGMNFPVPLDPDGKTAEDYRIYAIPTTFFIDGSGTIRERVEGSLTFSRLESIYRKLIKGQ